MKTRLRIPSLIALFVGVQWVFSPITTTAVTFSSLVTDTSVRNINDSDRGNLILEPASNYEPPNYGGPDSQYGSGTR